MPGNLEYRWAGSGILQAVLINTLEVQMDLDQVWLPSNSSNYTENSRSQSPCQDSIRLPTYIPNQCLRKLRARINLEYRNFPFCLLIFLYTLTASSHLPSASSWLSTAQLIDPDMSFRVKAMRVENQQSEAASFSSPLGYDSQMDGRSKFGHLVIFKKGKRVK